MPPLPLLRWTTITLLEAAWLTANLFATLFVIRAMWRAYGQLQDVRHSHVNGPRLYLARARLVRRYLLALPIFALMATAIIVVIRPQGPGPFTHPAHVWAAEVLPWFLPLAFMTVPICLCLFLMLTERDERVIEHMLDVTYPTKEDRRATDR